MMLRFRERLSERLRRGAMGDGGFSLVEVIVAIVILGIVSLLASRLLVGAISTTSKLDRQQTAVAIATMQMEAVRGADAAPNSNGVSALFDGRPRDQQLALFNTATNTAAASVADILAKTYPAWDTEVSGAHAAANAVVPPSGFGVETDSSGTVIYRDATGVRVYPVTGQDSFGSAYWSLSSGGAPIRATYQRVPSTAVDGAGTPLYTNTSDATQKMATAVSPTTVGGIPTIYQSAVNGSPSGEITLNGTKFKTTIILGTCFVETSQTAIGDDVNGTCEKAPGGTFTEPSAASPGTSPAIPDVGGYTPLVRAIVVVEWTAGCSAMQPCSYSLSSEFLPNIKDLKWRIGLP